MSLFHLPAPSPAFDGSAPPFSLLRRGVGFRLGLAAGAIAALWLAVLWAVS